MLHTGQGAAVLGLILGLIALSVPVMGATGALIWVGRRGGHTCATTPRQAVILVGSEGGSTWGFAATLARALRGGGQTVQVAPMSAFDPARHPRAERFLRLAATYGEGDAPASAKGFLDQLARFTAPPQAQLAVLGFGGRSFPSSAPSRQKWKKPPAQ